MYVHIGLSLQCILLLVWFYVCSVVRVSSPASVQPWEVIIHYEGHDASDVCVGVQPVLRMMIRHTSQVFLAAESEETRSSQLELCRRVLLFYQDVVMKWSLDHDTWCGIYTVYLRAYACMK